MDQIWFNEGCHSAEQSALTKFMLAGDADVSVFSARVTPPQLF